MSDLNIASLVADAKSQAIEEKKSLSHFAEWLNMLASTCEESASFEEAANELIDRLGDSAALVNKLFKLASFQTKHLQLKVRQVQLDKVIEQSLLKRAKQGDSNGE